MAYKRQISLKDLHVGKLTPGTDVVGGTPAYTNITSIKGAISASSSVNQSEESYYSDDAVEEVHVAVNSMTFEVEISNLSIEERALLLGQTTSGGMAVGNKDDIAPEVWVGFRSKRTDGTYRYVSLPKCKFSVPAEAYATEAESTTAQTITLTCNALPLISNGNYKITLDEGSSLTATQQTARNNWFTTPVIALVDDEE